MKRGCSSRGRCSLKVIRTDVFRLSSWHTTQDRPARCCVSSREASLIATALGALELHGDLPCLHYLAHGAFKYPISKRVTFEPKENNLRHLRTFKSIHNRW